MNATSRMGLLWGPDPFLIPNGRSFSQFCRPSLDLSRRADGEMVSWVI